MDDAFEILNWQLEAGVDLAIGDAPVNRFEQVQNTKPQQKPLESPPREQQATNGSSLADRIAGQAGKSLPTPPPPARTIADAVMPDETAVKSARDLAAAAGSLAELKQVLLEFQGCNLRRNAKNLVFGDGNPVADIMFVGETPERDEDLQGMPFIGRSGQLLDLMLAAIGMDRSSVYISNVIPWRPPGNRTPTPAETEVCLPFIERHIELVAPKILVMLGPLSAKTLLRTDDGILRLRGKWKQMTFASHSVDAISSLHPTFLLRQPGQKRLAWQDFLKIKAKFDEANTG